ncbi:hypothetical protein NADFUDRAFT_83556 [Nadsonia fulvescens var. elongata DSM 6958]|uniref:Phospholipid-transporting ATPase n=1 Tax=Nadsonia fulvescens var. elongata DSM 6958 TaxID=857566 RepID=A0A1E3PH37_9ASCO|nr:hypothetical protein NADFUDRAFT_83556 [Nadsonia fulvescens var. elongata DSM 6958]
MVFRKFSVAGHAWVHDLDIRLSAQEEPPIVANKIRNSTASARLSTSRKSQSSTQVHQKSRDQHGVLRTSVTSIGGKETGKSAGDTTNIDGTHERLSVDILHQMASLPRKSNVGSIGGRSSMATVQRTGTIQSSVWKSSADPKKTQSHRSTVELLQYLQTNPNGVYARRCRFFILSIAICHSCIPEFEGDLNNLKNLEYNAASPDEIALVSAARDLGFIVTDRQHQSLTICSYPQGLDMPPVNEVYKILETIEFSSARKRMSVLVQFPDGRICIICKGADNVILERLRSSDLAREKAADISKQSDTRKAMEAEFIMARNSLSSLPRASVGSVPRASININRENAVGSLENWLSNTNNEDEVHEIASNARRSMQVARQRKYGEKVITPRESLSSLRYESSAVTRSIDVNPITELVDAAKMLQTNDDFVIDDRLVLNEDYVIERTLEHIEDFSTEGLRTLLYSYRWMDKEEYDVWVVSYSEARTSLVDRQLKIENVGELVEHNLELCGATAIEDKLQKGVPETIDKLRRANIRLWMLTGDKRETAINVGYACRLIKDYSTVVVLRTEEGDLTGKITAALSEIEAGRVAHCVVVIDGATLTKIEEDMTLMTLFIDLGVKADSVVCCRASPSQKAAMVIAVRKKVKDSITLAIGDGANDIAMIQSADVGIGITGKEGLQAARTSDYSIAQFRYLSKLLLVHGRWNYVRICKYILGTFYKEIMFYLTQFFFQSNTMYTGSSLYENWSLSMFNTLFTSLPVICIGAFEKDMNPATLIAVPELYAKGQQNQAFNFKVFAGWMVLACGQSALISFLSYNFYGLYALRDNSTYALGVIPFSVCIFLITLKLQFLEVRARTIINLAVVLISVGGWFIWNLIIGAIMGRNGSKIFYVSHAFEQRFGQYAEWWASFWVIIAICAILEIIITTVRTSIAPTDSDVFAQLEGDVGVRLRLEEEAWEELQASWNYAGHDDLEARGFDIVGDEYESQSQSRNSNLTSSQKIGNRLFRKKASNVRRHARDDSQNSFGSVTRKRDSIKQKFGLGKEYRKASFEYEREIEEILRHRAGDMDIELENRRK